MTPVPLEAATVRDAVARWVFVPATAQVVETEEYLVVRFPDWWDRVLQLVRLTPRRPLDEVLDEVVVGCRRSGEPEVCCWVRLDAPEGLEEALRARGGRLDETLDVLARALDDVPDLEAPSDVVLRWATDRETLGDAVRLGTEVFGGEPMSDEDLERELAAEADKHADGRGGSVVAYLDGRPVGTGGVSVVDEDARLWGGAVLPEVRGRGVYRAVLRARLEYGRRHGARLALVKGRVETSGPILRRAGFEPFGQERSYLLAL